jgi:NAD dependent epimerase/dehydratase
VNWTGRTVLVTGGGGFIGSHLVELLLEEGARVRAFVHYNSRGDTRHLDAITNPELEVVAGDLLDPAGVSDAAEGREFIFHLGALIAIPYSYQHPGHVVRTNVIGTLNVLDAARRTGPARVVHVSTSEVYGTARSVPISEEHPLQGQSPYSASKIGADKVAESYARSFDVPVVTVRPFNTFGPRQSTRAVIPTIISQALYADQIRLGATRPTRDFTYVTDTARGMIAAAEAELPEWTEINLGTGQEISVGDLADRIMGLVGRELPIVTEDARLRPAASEVERLCSDNSKARELLGWAPQISLAEGLSHMIDWVKDHPADYPPDRYGV